MPTVIQVSHLSKSYRLGQIGGRTLSEDLNRWWARLRKQPDPYLKIGQEHLSDRLGERIWALNDVSFDVQQGEVLGIIGRNGAGKSTLLKVLSRITAPTSGEVRVKGRIASLLEVGTGFHPELTGRENVFLNGAILGMKRPEIERKFDEIIDFSGVEQFIDTPVKRYSSGMYVRLAFAVAAHLDPEILVVDEVLAVGDAEFQKKCLGKMGQVAGEGRTVLFVSHNMAAIQNLCRISLLLDHGSVIDSGDTEALVSRYLIPGLPFSSSVIAKYPKPAQFSTWITEAVFLTNGIPSSVLKYGDDLTIEMHFSSHIPVTRPGVGLAILSQRGEIILNTNNIYLNSPTYENGVTSGIIRYKLGKIPLTEGKYSITLWLGENEKAVHQQLDHALSFEVLEHDPWGRGRLPTRKYSYFWWPTEFDFIEDNKL